MRHLDRLWKKGLGGGAVMDLGIYAIQLALLVLGEEPERVIATGYLNEYGMEKNTYLMVCSLCPVHNK